METPCNLCGRVHRVSLHDFRPRILLTASFAEFRFTVVRIICHSSKSLRKKTHQKIQYTLTILPPFIGPYARIALKTLFKAFSRLASGANKDDAATMVSRAADLRPLNRYLTRFLKRAPEWTLHLCQWIIKFGCPLPSPDILLLGKNKTDMTSLWNIVSILAKLFCQNHEKTTANSIILLDFQTIFIHAKLSYAGMGLGP